MSSWGSFRSGSVAISLLALVSAPVNSQEPVRQPSVAITGGLGNVLGGLGAGLEYYFAQSHLSASAGLGYWPCSGTAAGGAALRAFVGSRHRGFLEGSYSLLAISCDLGGGQADRHYGPGISLGYRYTGSDGFTFTAGVGLGHPSGDPGTEALVLLGLGYTWRR